MTDAIIELFEELVQIEHTAVVIYNKLLKESLPDQVRKSIEGIRDDEIVHEENAKKILEILKE